MGEKVIIGVLRRSADDMSPEEHEAYAYAFSGREVVFVRMDSQDCYDHDRACQALGAEVVVLPKDRPIPSIAMDRGIQHITFVPGQGIVELEPLRPTFKPFVPIPLTSRSPGFDCRE